MTCGADVDYSGLAAMGLGVLVEAFSAERLARVAHVQPSVVGRLLRGGRVDEAHQAALLQCLRQLCETDKKVALSILRGRMIRGRVQAGSLAGWAPDGTAVDVLVERAGAPPRLATDLALVGGCFVPTVGAPMHVLAGSRGRPAEAIAGSRLDSLMAAFARAELAVRASLAARAPSWN